jgi:uncharacterized protein YndB with AHSA1/START domain
MTPADHIPPVATAAAAATEIVTTRVLAATRETVFAAIRDPRQLAQWWGPQGFTNEFREFDFRTGGVWRFTMRGPDGTGYEMDHRFAEIVAPERIVVRHLQAGHDFNLTITLIAREDRTEVTWRMRFDDPAEAARVRAFVEPANEQNLDRLAVHLAAVAKAPLSSK